MPPAGPLGSGSTPLPRDPAAAGLLPPPRDRSVYGRLAVLGLAALAAGHLVRLARAHPSFPLWDEAAHGVAGVEVADALRHFNPLEFFLAIQRQGAWPFVHSLVLAPFFLVFGRGFASAELASVTLWAGTALLAFLAGRTLHPTRGTWTGLAAAALALTAPIDRAFATLAMLEVPGAFFLLLAFVLHARTFRAPAARGPLVASGLASAALFFCKYNYGVLWLLPLALFEWLMLSAADRGRARAALRERATWRWWVRPVPAVLAVGAVAALTIELTGGTEFRVMRNHVSLHSAGNLLYALFLVALAWLLVPRGARGSRLAWLGARMPDRVRLLGGTLALPLATWFVLPGHLREFVGFLHNRETGPPPYALDALAFYPRAFLADYAPPGTGVVVLILAALVFLTLPGRRVRPAEGAPRSPHDLAAALAALAMVLGFLLTEAHRYRQGRFFFTVAPLVWLCAARTLVSAFDTVFRRIGFRAVREGLWGWLAGVLLLLGWLGAPLDSEVLERRISLRGPNTLAPALDAILDALRPRLEVPEFRYAALPPAVRLEPAPAPDANRDFPARAVLLGYGNVLSPGLVAWWARSARPEVPRAALPKRPPYLAPGAEDPALDARAEWVTAHADLAIAAFATALPQRLAGEYRDEVWADRETAARLALSSDWSRVSETRAGAWRVVVYERLP